MRRIYYLTTDKDGREVFETIKSGFRLPWKKVKHKEVIWVKIKKWRPEEKKLRSTFLKAQVISDYKKIITIKEIK